MTKRCRAFQGGNIRLPIREVLSFFLQFRSIDGGGATMDPEIKELRELFRETDQLFKETARRQEETARRQEETERFLKEMHRETDREIRRVSKLVGDIGNNFG